MKGLLLFVLAITASIQYAQDVKSHNLNLKINVKEKSIAVDDNMVVDFQGEDSVNFVLWKNSAIGEISMSGESLRFNFDTLSAPPIMYIPNGRRLTVFKSSSSNNDSLLRISYKSDMKNLSGWANSFSDEWIELNFYCAWYPVGTNDWGFTSNIKVNVDSNFYVSGSGKVSGMNDEWQVIQPWESFDNVVIVSNNLKSKILNENNFYIETDYSLLPPDDADSVLAECKFVLNLFENCFGKKDSSYLKFAFAPFEGGGYSRKNFVCLRTTKFNFHTRSGIAHETAHFWWTGANTSTWEDWLNEAFAEYSMLMYVRERLGNDEFMKKIEEYRNNTKSLPPVWGIGRFEQDAYSVLYEKGSVILYDLEAKVGKEAFIDFMKEVAVSKIHTTENLLNLVEKFFSTETKLWLENKLKTA